jgi:tetratricopeptide (TPR) repeat protein
VVDPWKTLGIAPTDDAREVKKAYAARIKRANPEDDPAGFQELRKAFELALNYARWHKAHREPPPEPPAPQARARPAAPAVPLDHGALKTHLRDFESQCAREAAAWLMKEVEELHDDLARFGSEDAWRSLLGNECLWNVESRHRFGRSLLELLVRNRLQLSPAIWCLLDREFRWSEQSLSFDRFLPRAELDRVLERLEKAPLERARQLFDEGRVADAEALLEPIATGPDVRAAVAREMLERCSAERKADRLMRAVERLRADERAWSDAACWRDLLSHGELKLYEVRAAFQKALLDYLTRNGEGLRGDVWRELDAEFDWSKHLPPDELARVVLKLSSAIVEHIESLFEQGDHKAVIQRWRLFASRLEAEASEKADRLADRSGSALLERAEALAAALEHRGAIAEARVLLLLPASGLRQRAKELVQRCLVELVEAAERLFDRSLEAEVIAQLEPVINELDAPLMVRARLLLSWSHLRRGAPEKAVAHLEEVLRLEPRNVTALSALAIAYRARGLLGQASSTYRKILWLEPDNEHVARELEALLGKEAEHRESRPTTPRSDPVATSEGAPSAYFPVSLLLALAALGRLLSLGEGRLDPQAVVVVKLIGASSLIGGLFSGLLLLNRREGPLALGLHLSSSEPRFSPDPAKRRRIAYLKATLAASVIVALAGLWWAVTR